MNYRILNAEEWPKLYPLFDEMGFLSALPAPEISSAAVAENEDGTIEGAFMLQMQLHLEPILIRSPKVDFRRLYRTIQDAVKERGYDGLTFYCFISSDHVARGASILGMERTPYEVWQGRVE